MSTLFEKCGFRAAVRDEFARTVSLEALLAFKSSGDPTCVPVVDIFVAAPSIRVVKDRNHWWLRRRAPAKTHPGIRMSESLADDEEEVATPRDRFDRRNYELSRCADLAVGNQLTGAMERFRRGNLLDIREREDARKRQFSSG